MPKLSKKQRIIFCAFFLTVYFLFGISTDLYAQNEMPDWVTGNITISNPIKSSLFTSYNNTCSPTNVEIETQTIENTCLTFGSKVRVIDLGNGTYNQAVSIGYDANAHLLLNESTSRHYTRLIPNTDTAIITDETTHELQIVDNFSQRLIQRRIGNMVYYDYKDIASPTYSLNGDDVVYGQLYFSTNGKYVAYVKLNQRKDNFEFIAIDLTTHKQQRVGIPPQAVAYSLDIFKNIAISNDGKYLAAVVSTGLQDTGFHTSKYGLKLWRLDACSVDSDWISPDGLEDDMCESKIIDIPQIDNL